jgi:hypothetical protein
MRPIVQKITPEIRHFSIASGRRARYNMGIRSRRRSGGTGRTHIFGRD